MLRARNHGKSQLCASAEAASVDHEPTTGAAGALMRRPRESSSISYPLLAKLDGDVGMETNSSRKLRADLRDHPMSPREAARVICEVHTAPVDLGLHGPGRSTSSRIALAADGNRLGNPLPFFGRHVLAPRSKNGRRRDGKGGGGLSYAEAIAIALRQRAGWHPSGRQNRDAVDGCRRADREELARRSEGPNR